MNQLSTPATSLLGLLALCACGTPNAPTNSEDSPVTNVVAADVVASDLDAPVGDADAEAPVNVEPAPDVPWVNPQPDVIPISNALCEDATLVFPASEATTKSQTAHFGMTPTATATMTASVGDVDRDGRTDLVLGTELYLNCGTGGFVQVALPPLGLAAVSATAILQLDGDGRPDLMFGDISGHVVLVHQQEDGTFTVGEPFVVADGDMVTTLVPFADRDRDGRPDHVYASMYNYPPNGFLTSSPAAFGQEFDENRSSNALLAIAASGEIDMVPLPADVVSCGDGPTMSAQVIARHHLGEPDAIYLCTTWGPDCVYPLTADGIPDEPMYLPGGASSYTKLNWAMGVDHTYTDDGVIFAVSDVGFQLAGRPPANLWVLGPDGLVVPKPDEPITEPPAVAALLGWGVHFADFDLDGYTDLFFAHGRGGIIREVDDAGEPIVTWPMTPVDPGGIILFAGTDGPFEQRPEAEPPEVDDRAAYSAIVGDFYGNDGFGDGCLDVVLTSVLLPRCDFDAGECLSDEPVPVDITFEHTAAILRNRCADDGPRPFVGVRTPLSDAGAVLRMTWGDGTVAHRPIRSTAGLGGTVEPSAVFAIPAGTEVQALDLVHPGNVVVPVSPGPDGYSGWLTP